jgi:uncharacterized protein YjbI with pentapeptide repeats
VDSNVMIALIGAGSTLLVGLLTAWVAMVTRRVTLRRADQDRDDAVRRADAERDAALDRLNRQLDAQAADTAAREGRADERHRLDLAQARARLMSERFGKATEQMAGAEPAVRVAGVYAMATLADEWMEQRQQCVDVLCAYLRLPVRREDGEAQVRATVVSVVRQHLVPRADPSWQALDFDLRAAVFPSGAADFTEVVFAGNAWFQGADFQGAAWFVRARFAGSTGFDHATFHDRVAFDSATVVGHAGFAGVTFLGDAGFWGAAFEQTAGFDGATFCQAARFAEATFRGRAGFQGAVFGGGVDFSGSSFGQTAWFHEARFVGRSLFRDADFGGDVRFSGAVVEQPLDLTAVMVPPGHNPRFYFPDGGQTTDPPLIGRNTSPGAAPAGCGPSDPRPDLS